MSEDMVERVARAIVLAGGLDPDEKTCDFGNGVLADLQTRWEFAAPQARAAIEALREPTEAMKHCSEEVHWGYSCHQCGGLTEGWYAMIDAALSPSGV